jgi:hypothetical protein
MKILDFSGMVSSCADLRLRGNPTLDDSLEEDGFKRRFSLRISRDLGFATHPEQFACLNRRFLQYSESLIRIRFG